MRFAKLRFAAAGALFLAWIGYLVYLVAAHARPAIDWRNFKVTKHPPAVLSRSQFLFSEADVSAQIDEPTAPDKANLVYRLRDCQVLWKAAGIDLRDGDEVEVRTSAAGLSGWQGPGRYLVPLKRNGSGGYDVVPIPPTPGYVPGRDATRIYPDEPATRGQQEEIRK